MIKNILIDCDGVLTDGKKYVDKNGQRQFIAFHSRDNEAVERLQESGYRVIIVTASMFTGIRRYWHKYGVEVFNLPGNKQAVFNQAKIDPAETLGVGDDIMDLQFLKMCAQAYVVQDASEEIKKLIPALDMRGGSGVMVEVYLRLTIKSSYSLKDKSIA